MKKHKYLIISTTFSLAFATFLGRVTLPQKPADFIADNAWLGIVIFVYAFIISLLIWIGKKIWNNNFLKAELYLWRAGKLRGLWQGDGLVKQLEKYSDESANIQIKVTRGIDLLEKDKKYGFWKIFQEINGKVELDRKVVVQALLIVPCFKEKHVKARYETHKELDNISEDTFLETWYEFLKKASEYRQMLTIITRFYFGNHSKWRFYIFSPPEDGTVPDKQIVLFSDYDGKRDGRNTPMYKVIKNDRNIGGFMSRYFDEIWSESLTPNELSEAIEKGELKPKNACFREYSCTGCTHYQVCTGFIKKYSQYLLS